jgi:hypothetical protein
VVAEYILIVMWLRRRTKGARRAALIGLALCIILPIVQKLVVTQREQLRAITETLIDAAENGNVQVIARRIDRNFRVGDIDHDRFIEGVKRVLTQIKIEDARITGFHVEVDGDTAKIELGVMAQIITRQEFSGQQPTSWTLTYVRTDRGWMLTAVEPRSTPLFPYDKLEQIIR